MIRRGEICLQAAGQERIYPNLAYALYGELCSRMKPDLADMLHLCEITPLRQHLRKGEVPGQYVWVLDLFDRAASLTSLLESLSVIHLDCCTAPLQVVECRISQPISAMDLLRSSQEQPISALCRITFQTPCTFKAAGHYVLFPSEKLIAQSLFQRWNGLITESVMQDDEALQMLTAGLTISRYRLHSQDYRIKGQRITGFVGHIDIYARMSAPMQELWRLLLAFAPYGGIGIKTALGMGAVVTEPVLPKIRNNPLSEF